MLSTKSYCEFVRSRKETISLAYRCSNETQDSEHSETYEFVHHGISLGSAPNSHLQEAIAFVVGHDAKRSFVPYILEVASLALFKLFPSSIR